MAWRKKLALTLVFLAGLLFLFTQIDLQKIRDIVSQVRMEMIFGIIACMIVAFLLWNLRWQFALHKLTKFQFWRLLPILMAGMFFNMVTPTAGLGGEPVRVYYISKLSKARRTSMFVLTALEKFFGTIIMVVMLVFSVLFAAFFIPGERVVKGILIALFLILVLLIIVLGKLLKKIKIKESKYLHYLLKLAFRIRMFAKKFSSYKEFEKYVEDRLLWAKILTVQVLKKRVFVLANLLLTLAITLVNYLAFYLSLIAFNAELPFVYVMVVFTIASVIADITFIPGGVGLTEAIAIGMYNAFGVSLEIAALATLLYRTVYYFFTIGIGYCCLIYLHMKE